MDTQGVEGLGDRAGLGHREMAITHGLADLGIVDGQSAGRRQSSQGGRWGHVQSSSEFVSDPAFLQGRPPMGVCDRICDSVGGGDHRIGCEHLRPADQGLVGGEQADSGLAGQIAGIDTRHCDCQLGPESIPPRARTPRGHIEPRISHGTSVRESLAKSRV